MSAAITTFLVVTRAADAQATTLGREIASWLAAHGATAELCEHDSGDLALRCDGSRYEGFGAVLVLGGDGTFIGVARRSLGRGAVLLGLNLGRVGFLAEPLEGWPQRLSALLAGAYRVSRRLCLEYELLRQGAVVQQGRAVNDLVVSRGDLARLIRLSVGLDGGGLAGLRADGLIVSTPTGSTAYGFSAGGPLVHPEMEAVCLTPVCPFLNNFRPMVLPSTQPLRVRVDEGRSEVRLSVDGQRCVALFPGDELLVRRAERDLLVAETGGRDYLAKLSAKGFLTER